MRKQYPTFIIDRSRRSEASRFTDDFVVCPDKEVGFIARVYAVPKSRRDEFYGMIEAIPEQERDNKYYIVTVHNSMVVLEIVEMLYTPIMHINRLRPLMKKAIRAYLYGEVAAIQDFSTSYDEQIAAVEELVRAIESPYVHMVDARSKDTICRRITAIRAAIDSLKLLKKIVKHE